MNAHERMIVFGDRWAAGSKIISWVRGAVFLIPVLMIACSTAYVPWWGVIMQSVSWCMIWISYRNLYTRVSDARDNYFEAKGEWLAMRRREAEVTQ